MTDDTTLRIERLIDAPPEAVFRVWTTREAMESWYRDGDDFVARVAELDRIHRPHRTTPRAFRVTPGKSWERFGAGR